MALLRLLLLALIVLGGGAAWAQSIQLSEEKIKAGLIFSLIKFIDWPDGLQGTLTVDLCLYGGDPLSGVLDKLQGRSIQQRKIRVRHIGRPSETAGCRLIYLHPDAKESWPELRNQLAGKSVLTIADFPNFTRDDGMIAFRKSNARIVTDLNLDVVKAAGLHVQDRLLQLVTVVKAGKVP